MASTTIEHPLVVPVPPATASELLELLDRAGWADVARCRAGVGMPMRPCRRAGVRELVALETGEVFPICGQHARVADRKSTYVLRSNGEKVRRFYRLACDTVSLRDPA